MSKTKTRAYIIFIVAFALIGTGFFILDRMVQNESNNTLCIHEVISQADYSNNDLFIEMSTSKSWTQNSTSIGAQYDGIIHNNSNHIINNWYIDITVPDSSYIDSSWNGVYTRNGSRVHITPVDYNASIEKNSTDTFGYIMITPTGFSVENITFCGNLVYTREDFPLYNILIAASVITLTALLLYFIITIRDHSYKVKKDGYRQIIMQSLNTFANFIDAKDPYTRGHSIRVAIYTREIARRMGMNEDELDNISYVALLHDVGKIGIPNEVLFKPCELTLEEMKIVQSHTTIGAEILKDFNAIPAIKDGVRSHHEKFGGGGYPDGLQGKNIPLIARIICVADCYDAMSSDRCYRPRLNEENILTELERCSGSQFDPEIVPHIIGMIKDGFVKCVQEREAQKGIVNSYPLVGKDIAAILNSPEDILSNAAKERD